MDVKLQPTNRCTDGQLTTTNEVA